MADFFQEVDEDLKREAYLKLWQKYGRYAVGAAVAIVLATAGVIGWREYQTSQRMEEGRRYEAALHLIQDGKPEEALAALAELADSGTGYGALAGLREGALRAKEGDTVGAVAAYNRIAENGSLDTNIRQLATLLAVLHGLDSEAPAAMVARLEPLTADDSPWRHSALELSALAALRAGETARAREIFTRLTDDSTAPSGVRGRAEELLSVIGE